MATAKSGTNMKYLCAGLSRTGTLSLHKAMEILGYKSLHWEPERLRDVIMGENQLPDWRRYDDVDVVTGPGCRIGPFSVLRGPMILGDNVKIGPHAEIARTIILDNTVIAHKNVILDSIIGESAHISGRVGTANKPTGRNTINGFFNDKATVLSNRYGCSIGDHADLGVDIIIMPGSHIKENSTTFGPSIIYGNGKVRNKHEIPLRRSE